VIRVGEVDEQLLVAWHIGRFSFTTCVTPALLDASCMLVSPDQMHNLPTLSMISTHGNRALSLRFLRDGKQHELALKHQLVVNNTNAYLAVGLVSLGIMQTLAYSVRDVIAVATLASIFEVWQPPANQIYVIYPPNRYLNAKIRVFID
jgi:DNA-binding transcriptional LysR family regulator